MRLFLLLVACLAIILPIALARDNGEGVLYRSVEDQMRETLEMAEKYPNASPKELAALLGSSHGRGFAKNSVKTNENALVAAPPTTPPAPAPTQPQQQAAHEPNGQTDQNSEVEKAPTNAHTQATTTTAPPTRATQQSNSSSTTNITSTETPAHTTAFLMLFLFLLIAFVTVVYFAYLKWSESNSSAGLYQPLQQSASELDGDESDIELDDIESGSYPVEHGFMYSEADQARDLQALDSITSHTHTKNNSLYEKQMGLDSGFGYQEVLASPVAPTHAVTLSKQPPQNVQSDQVIEINDTKGPNFAALAQERQKRQENGNSTNTFGDNNNNNNTQDNDDFDSWESAPADEVSSPQLSALGVGGLDGGFDPFGGLGAAAGTVGEQQQQQQQQQPSQQQQQSSITSTPSKPSMNSDSISLSAMLGASYAGADSRIKSTRTTPGAGGGASGSSSGSVGSSAGVGVAVANNSTSPNSKSPSGRPQVIMKDPSTRGEVQKPRTLGVSSHSNSDSPDHSLPTSTTTTSTTTTLPDSPAKQFTSFAPIVVDAKVLSAMQVPPMAKMNDTFQMDEDAIFGSSSSSDSGSSGGVLGKEQGLVEQSTVVSQAQMQTQMQTQTQPQAQPPTQAAPESASQEQLSQQQEQQQPQQQQSQPQPQQPPQINLDDEFGFDLGGAGDDDDWFQDVPDTSAAMDLIQKSNSILAGLDL